MCEEIKCGLLESSEINYKIVKAWMESIKNLQFMMRSKIDIATFEFLMAGNEYINDESFNIEYCITDKPEKDISIPPITMCLWGNLSKNLRHKGMDLPEIGLSFELPPDLIRINCAVRILHSLFDFATPSFCATSLPKFFSLGNIPTQETYFETLLKDIYSENYSQHKDIHKEETVLGKSAPAAGKLAAAVENALTAKVDSEKTSPAMVFTPPEEPEITIVDHCEYFVVGGFYHFDLLQLPTPTVKVDCWIFTYCEDKVLKHIPYHTSIIPIRHPKPDMSPAVAAEFADSEIKRFDKEMCSAISISIQLSEEILFLEQPLPAFWLEDRKGFTTIGFYETKHDEDTGRLFFKTNHFGIIGMLQRKYNNMPYQSWELTSEGQANCASLFITGMHVGIQIEILDSECCIKKIEQDGKSLFPNCYTIWMSPDKLVKKLAFMGINITVENDVDKYIETSKKEETMESWTFSCMSVLCHSFNFYWSRWNATLPKDQIVLKYRPQDSDEPEKFSHILIMPDNSVVIKCAESHSKFCDDPADGEKKWKDLYHLVKERSEEEIPFAKHFEFVNAVYFLLSTCKLFSCS
ncbi:dynein axonemal intermediate chain 7 homolog [Uloborus diversus]|uniref:dynein axonemal intermediate chain 7 homolog n=1 Tax=Uloborus diversus TaxID=327109 RepID=UPI00240906FA|nr:dynein axonemal intermediate chain 7 homolog [Uloborus diversus]